MLLISQLFIYPIKSLAGIAVDKARVTDRGFEYDRRWMLVDLNNRFISQREVHQMALIKVQVTDKGLRVNHTTKNSSFTIPFLPATSEFADVTIWDDTCTGQFVSDEADKWFSNMLEMSCRLVYMTDETTRVTDPRYAPDDSITSFSDAYPFLLIGQASLDDLNSRLNEPLPMNRFRPNIVFTGGTPFQEDMMGTFSVGDITFYGVKLCARCVMTTIDQETAIKYKEPLKTLARYRFKDNKILFGQNLAHEGLGEVSIGDTLRVLKLNYEDRFVMPAK
ncbi:MAG TPA: MOSC N-terminal beta barrel domain-containing protein [Mucilaginibacter sp.]|nr:MOSC N-terminal beta barrel domain-containing protein [Mucilaginibacter sp.]